MTIPGDANDFDYGASLSGFAKSLPALTPDNMRETWKQIAGCRLFHTLVPKPYGGAQDTAATLVQKMLQFGEGCCDASIGLGVNSQIWTVQEPLLKFGSEKQRSKYLPDLLRGDTFGAFALTEEKAGSDALSLETRAERSGNGYILNGSKAFISMGPVCDFVIVFATTAPDRGRWGISAFVVEADDHGFIRVDAQKKLGLNGIPMGKLAFQDCWIPETRRVGPEGAGATILQKTLDWERCFILSAQVGAMQRQLDEVAEFAGARTVFGQKITEFQSVSNRIADMRVRLETSKLMLERAAELFDQDAPLTQFAAMANLHISEALLSSGLDAMRCFGGRGYLQGSSSGADISDALGGVIYSGTSDIQRQIIAKLEMGRHRHATKTSDDNDRS